MKPERTIIVEGWMERAGAAQYSYDPGDLPAPPVRDVAPLRAESV